MTVLLETDAIGARDEVGAHLWLENPDTLPLSTATALRWTGPAFLHLGTVVDSACVRSNGPVPIPSVGAKSTTILDLCVASDRVVVEGTFAVGFTLLYGKGTAPQTSYLLVEKQLRVGLFGSDTVAGVSLRLASFVVPGLLFFFLLQLRGVLAATTLDALRLSTLSVLFSIMLSGIVAWAFPPLQARGISVLRFVMLCAVAAAIAGVVIWIRQKLNAAAVRRKVGPADSEIVALGKALKLKNTGGHPYTLTLTTGEEFIGAAAAPRAEGGTALLGWFELTVPASVSAADRETLQKLAAAGAYGRLLDMALERELDLTPLNGLRERVKGSISDVAGAPLIRRFAAAEVQALVEGTVQGIVEEGPIRVQ